MPQFKLSVLSLSLTTRGRIASKTFIKWRLNTDIVINKCNTYYIGIVVKEDTPHFILLLITATRYVYSGSRGRHSASPKERGRRT